MTNPIVDSAIAKTTESMASALGKAEAGDRLAEREGILAARKADAKAVEARQEAARIEAFKGRVESTTPDGVKVTTFPAVEHVSKLADRSRWAQHKDMLGGLLDRRKKPLTDHPAAAIPPKSVADHPVPAAQHEPTGGTKIGTVRRVPRER